MNIRQYLLLFLVGFYLALVLYGCSTNDNKRSNEAGQYKHPVDVKTDRSLVKNVSQAEAIRIAEMEVRKRVHIETGETLHTVATRDDNKCGWDMTVSLIPGGSGLHWIVFVADSGEIKDFQGGM